jgi:hypothetical protein
MSGLWTWAFGMRGAVAAAVLAALAGAGLAAFTPLPVRAASYT